MSETNFIVEPGSHSITVTHLYDAPRELVFKAYTDPGLIPEWWGPKMLYHHHRPDGSAPGREVALYPAR